MNRRNDVDELLTSLETRRPWDERPQTASSHIAEPPTEVPIQITPEDVEELAQRIATANQAFDNPPAVEQPFIEEVPEIPQEVLGIMDQYITPEPRNLEESVDDIQLSEEEEKRYDAVVARDETARFSSADWFQKAQSFGIVLAGLGGIGSWAALLLARLKPLYLELYDADRVEMVNLAGQLYGVDDIGKYKVSAVSDYVRTNANYYNFSERNYPFTDSCYSEPVMICGFDNMEARKTFFNKWKAKAFRNPETLFIDGRLTATEFQVFCMTGEDFPLMRKYEDEFLFDDSEASQEVCSFKQTAYLANMIAGVMVNLYINFCANLCGSPFKKALPFITKYNTDVMRFSIEY